MEFLQGIGTTIIIIAIIVLGFWISWYGTTKECSKNTKDINDGIYNLDCNFVKHHEKIYRQNQKIIENQEKLIELLSKDNKKEE